MVEKFRDVERVYFYALTAVLEECSRYTGFGTDIDDILGGLCGGGAGLTIYERVAIHAYTANEIHVYFIVNSSLRTYSATPDVLIVCELLEDTLSAMSPYVGTTYRGMKVDEDKIEEFIAEYEPSKRAVWKSFTSASLDIDYATESGRNVLFVIQSKSGRRIDHLSVHPEEHEVLFRPDFSYQVIGWNQVEHLWVVEIEELD